MVHEKDDLLEELNRRYRNLSPQIDEAKSRKDAQWRVYKKFKNKQSKLESRLRKIKRRMRTQKEEKPNDKDLIVSGTKFEDVNLILNQVKSDALLALEEYSRLEEEFYALKNKSDQIAKAQRRRTDFLKKKREPQLGVWPNGEYCGKLRSKDVRIRISNFGDSSRVDIYAQNKGTSIDKYCEYVGTINKAIRCWRENGETVVDNRLGNKYLWE